MHKWRLLVPSPSSVMGAQMQYRWSLTMRVLYWYMISTIAPPYTVTGLEPGGQGVDEFAEQTAIVLPPILWVTHILFAYFQNAPGPLLICCFTLHHILISEELTAVFGCLQHCLPKMFSHYLVPLHFLPHGCPGKQLQTPLLICYLAVVPFLAQTGPCFAGNFMPSICFASFALCVCGYVCSLTTL